MKSFSKNFLIAVKDYIFLLENKYPQKNILKLVGDRYKLNRTERAMLYRGITTRKNCSNRISKLLPELHINKNEIYIDTFNQLFTIRSYLEGKVVFIGNDGFLRDASEYHGKVARISILERSVELTLLYLKELSLTGLVFLIDKQITKYQLVSNVIKELALKSPVPIEVKVSESVDRILINTFTGIVATSDSQIIEKSKVKIFDLARQTLEFHFNPDFFNLAYLENKKS